MYKKIYGGGGVFANSFSGGVADEAERWRMVLECWCWRMVLECWCKVFAKCVQNVCKMCCVLFSIMIVYITRGADCVYVQHSKNTRGFNNSNIIYLYTQITYIKEV